IQAHPKQVVVFSGKQMICAVSVYRRLLQTAQRLQFRKIPAGLPEHQMILFPQVPLIGSQHRVPRLQGADPGVCLQPADAGSLQKCKDCRKETRQRQYQEDCDTSLPFHYNVPALLLILENVLFTSVVSWLLKMMIRPMMTTRIRMTSTVP